MRSTRLTQLLALTTLLLGSLFGTQVAAADDTAPAAENPHVILTTNFGDIEIELLPKRAPLTTENFLTYVSDGYYTDTVFHRVIPGFMIQGGGMMANMTEKATKAPVVNESKSGLSNRRGTLAMARTQDPDSATSQFFINTVDNASLDARGGDAGYTVFGIVVKGMDVVDRISGQPTGNRGMHQNVPTTPVVIQSATVKAAATK